MCFSNRFSGDPDAAGPKTNTSPHASEIGIIFYKLFRKKLNCFAWDPGVYDSTHFFFVLSCIFLKFFFENDQNTQSFTSWYSLVYTDISYEAKFKLQDSL